MNDFQVVIMFSRHTSKQIFCAHNGIDYENICRNNTCARNALPPVFALGLERLVGRKPLKRPVAMWREMFIELERLNLSGRASLAAIRTICQYVDMRFSNFFLFFAEIPPKYIEPCKTAIGAWYSTAELHKTSLWMYDSAIRDMYTLSRLVDKITTRLLTEHSCRPFKRLLAYAHRLYTTPLRWYMDQEDSPFGDVENLYEARRAYEHVMFGRFSLMDTSSPDAPLQALYEPHNAYRHTSIDRRCSGATITATANRDKPHLMLYGGDRLETLTIFGAQRGGGGGGFDVRMWQAALELMETSESHGLSTVVKCSLCTDHHRIYGEGISLDYLDDVGSIGLSIQPPMTKYNYSSVNLARRLTDFSSGLSLDPITAVDNDDDTLFDNLTGGVPKLCEKKNLLHNHLRATNVEQAASTLKCFVLDYLLSEIALEPTKTNKKITTVAVLRDENEKSTNI